MVNASLCTQMGEGSIPPGKILLYRSIKKVVKGDIKLGWFDPISLSDHIAQWIAFQWVKMKDKNPTNNFMGGLDSKLFLNRSNKIFAPYGISDVQEPLG